MASEAVSSETTPIQTTEKGQYKLLTRVKTHVRRFAKPAARGLLLAAAVKGAAMLPSPNPSASHQEQTSFSAQNPHENPARLLVPNIYKREPVAIQNTPATTSETTANATPEANSPAMPPEINAASKVEELKNKIAAEHEITLSEDTSKLHHIFETLSMYPPQQRVALDAEPWDEERLEEMENVLSLFPKTFTASDEDHYPIVIIATNLPEDDRAFSWESQEDRTFYIVIDDSRFTDGNREELMGTVAHELFHRATPQDLAPLQNDLNAMFPGMTFDEGAKLEMAKVTGMDPNSTAPLTDEQKQKLPGQIAFLHAMTDDFGPYLAEYYIKGKEAFYKEFSQFLAPEHVNKLYEVTQKYALSIIKVAPTQ